MNLDYPITYIKGVSVQRATLFYTELGIKTCNDLLNFFPFRYIDKTAFYAIKDLQPNSSEVQIVGKITNVKSVAQKRGSRLVATFQDTSGTMELVWFKGQKWIKDSLKIGVPYVVYGKLNHYNGNFSIPHPEMELVTEYKKKLQTKMQPVYPSTEKLTNSGVSNKLIRNYIQSLLQQFYDGIQESLSEEIINDFKLMQKRDALLNLHFPKNQENLAKAQYRLKFEELFFIQLQLVRKKLVNKTKIKGFVFENVSDYFNGFYKNNLPFDLTNAQKRVLKEIRKDVASGAHMNRLLQGDVGSGKTIVALLTMLLALDNGFQATIMAPTEILANQHYMAVSELLEGMDINVDILTGSVKTKKRREIHQNLEDGTLHILIGTHALLEDKVKFKNLGIAIIDEQHRFGVKQRAKLWTKNELPPHILVMTATPIPRTLAMSVYGDLDISVIDELPPGRKEVKTVHRYDSNRLSVFKFMKDEIAKGRQVYIVYPLIQESEAMDYKDLMDGYESVSREFPLPKYQISIVHGKMKPADKDYEMQRFVNGETQIMVATTVIEVGVNVPNASVMIIESSERFGLSQLHQLRGRVGRGADQSYCILLSSFKLSVEAKTRLKTMVETSDGFKIAEVDLKLRGPGNIMGTQQSGVLNLKIADVVKDSQILVSARNTAIDVLQEDPNLSKKENLPIRNTFFKMSKTSKVWSNIS
ncbi:DNA helicase RecG [Polaribacter reichenbachii]|uniref:ATP-dependent DNA helicase RecG n=1 Tax=Polaribacter reichenbachii TaxID=996801 RepID=A0A1B8U2C2_9FLAO|nr:ATP-dependent DNA helicase RecG [Polaribacter reichenbachii]APZ47737.1 DNA helicase RecG [Polaribacter reichenbachii]AUC18371.1 DNA helicase RecG [Polaribacter reichenbachii]OBY66020.1 ATP-dependent DNA helicase RecG [Polaribacter reichenbachii]